MQNQDSSVDPNSLLVNTAQPTLPLLSTCHLVSCGSYLLLTKSFFSRVKITVLITRLRGDKTLAFAMYSVSCRPTQTSTRLTI